MTLKKSDLLMAGLAALLFAGLGLVARSRHGEWLYAPFIAAWALASVNFVLAVKSALWARGLSITRAMAVIFGGFTARMILFLSAAAAVFALQKPWTFSFVLPLLGCFFIYFLAELALLLFPVKVFGGRR